MGVYRTGTEIRKEQIEKWKARIAGVLSLVWAGIIFFFSAQEKEESGAVSEAVSYRMVKSTGLLFHLQLSKEQIEEISYFIEHFVRKAAHMTEYAVLAIFLYLWLGSRQKSKAKRGITAAGLAALYAVSDEIHQLFVPGRAGMISDVLLDSLGAVLGILIFLGVEKCISFLWNRHKYKEIKLS